MNEQIGDVFGRDSHLTMLSLDRYDAGELAPDARLHVQAHVECCAGCRARLAAVQHPSVVIVPPRVPGRSTGSVTVSYLVATAVTAVAAALVASLGAPWPSAHTAREHARESTHVASSYTSVAQEYSDALELELEVAWGDTVVATPSVPGWFALVTLRGGREAGRDEVEAVLAGPRSVGETVRVALPRRIGSQRVVALLCPVAFTIQIGETFAPDPDCIARERGGAP